MNLATKSDDLLETILVEAKSRFKNFLGDIYIGAFIQEARNYRNQEPRSKEKISFMEYMFPKFELEEVKTRVATTVGDNGTHTTDLSGACIISSNDVYQVKAKKFTDDINGVVLYYLLNGKGNKFVKGKINKWDELLLKRYLKSRSGDTSPSFYPTEKKILTKDIPNYLPRFMRSK